jgi:hypothetical protein
MVMVFTPVELPDNLSACHAVILRQAETIERLDRDLASLKRQLFGSRRERFEASSAEDPVGQGAAVAGSGMDGGMVEAPALECGPTASELLAAATACPSGAPAHTVMPRVHRVAALLHRWWLGTHQGAISPKHLDYYLDEYAFRFNRRQSRAPGMLFYRLLEQSVNADPVAYCQLIGGKSGQDREM